MAPAHPLLARGLRALGGQPCLQAPLTAYLDLLLRWNRRYNLVGTEDRASLITRHVLDCLALAPWFDADPLLDVGSGAGLPGLILAMAAPQRRVVVLDARLKKTVFLEQARIELELANVEVVRSDVRDYRPDQPFPLITSRAFAALGAFHAACRHLLAADGRLLAMTGHVPQAELAVLAGRAVRYRVDPVHVPGLAAQRHVVTVFGSPAATPPR
jgi:16S rRNA (guanine527-N7)-methyltransferase